MSLPMQNVYIFGAGKSGVSAARALCKKGYTPKLVSQNEPSSWNCYEELISFMSKELLINQSKITSEEFKNSSLISSISKSNSLVFFGILSSFVITAGDFNSKELFRLKYLYTGLIY